jgi:transposase
VRVLWPHLAAARVEAVSAAGPVVRIQARTSTAPAACPGCGMVSNRVHSRYDRHLSDAATAGREVLIRLSRMTLLRMVRDLPDPDHPTPRVLGVDDFALRRGHHYGTLLVDVESHRPVDVLTDRTAQTVANWLRAHPGVQIICRDRASAYAEAARDGAPDAVQVADRWHVWHNLAEAIERIVAQHQDHLSAALTVDTDSSTEIGEATPADNQSSLGAPPVPVSPARPDDRTDRWALRARERHAAVHTLLAEGVGIKAICRQLDLARGTVRRFARAETVEELLTRTGTGRRPSLLEQFKPYLHERWNAGCTNAAVLFTEIAGRGYRGGPTLVRHYLHQFRAATRIPAPPRKPPSVRRVVSWIMTDPATIDPADQQRLDAILAASPPLNELAGHVRRFATMMCSLRGEDLEAWMSAADASGLPALRSFVLGLRRDQDAVTAGLTLPWSSGIVEGHVNRLKMLKRQMFGRAKPDLLRKRVLLAE